MKNSTILAAVWMMCIALSSPLFAQTLQSDDFNAFNLKRSIWTFTDPLGDATLTLVGTNSTNARLSLSISGSISHDPFLGEDRIPRIMQTTEDSDFVIQVKFESALTLPYQIQGIIVEATPAEFLRFDFYGNGTQTRIFSALAPGGTAAVDSAIGAASIQPLYMRVTRIGNSWTQEYSFDGTNWTIGTSFTYTMTVAKAGVYLGNANGGSGTPAHTLLVDYFQNNASPIVSEDGNSAVVDSLKPLIYSIASNPTSSSLQVNWKTDERANGRVEYGTSTSYELGFISHGSFTTSHSLQINGLDVGTTYHYRIVSADSVGNADTTSDRTATTTNPFIISGVQVYKTSASATFTWTTLLNTSSKVYYGTTTLYGDSLVDSTRVTSHFLNITGLNPVTLYHFKLVSIDSLGNIMSTQDSTLTTIPTTTLIADEFNSGTLNGAWQFFNPSGDGTQSMTGTHVSLGVISGSRHEIWNDINNAPRIRQNCNNADFEVTVKFDSGMTQGFQEEGLVIQQDSVNLIRFDFNTDGTSTYMFAMSLINNGLTIRLNQLGVAPGVNVAPLYIRVTRHGAAWTQEYSLNGTTWTTGVTFTHLMNVSSAGIFTGNAGGNPAFTSLVDYFRLPAGPTGVIVNVKALLEGPYVASADSMNTDVLSSLPLTQPYGSSSWSYSGAEQVDTIPPDVVDWVLLELRTSTSAASKLATRAAFIKKDGTVVDTSGTGEVTFVNVYAGNYYVVVHQRNHLSIMSANALALSLSSTVYDFTTGSSQAYGTTPMKQLNTKWGMYAGDANASGGVSSADVVQTYGAIYQVGYDINDINMSGIVSATDANIILKNLNKISQVP